MYFDERYLGGCHRASSYLANKFKKARLLDHYSITHVTVVVDPIRAKSCTVDLCPPCFAVGA